MPENEPARKPFSRKTMFAIVALREVRQAAQAVALPMGSIFQTERNLANDGPSISVSPSRSSPGADLPERLLPGGFCRSNKTFNQRVVFDTHRAFNAGRNINAGECI